MRNTVVWDASALDELTVIWNQAADRQAIADAADEIDRLLRTSAAIVRQGDGLHCRLVVDPLEVIFTYSPNDCLVQVLQVRSV